MISFLANRDEGSPWRDAGVAMAWFALGLLLLWGLPELRITWWGSPDAPATVTSVLVLAVGCAAVVLRRILAPVGLLIGTVTLLAGPFWLGRTDLGTLVVFTDLLYCAMVYPSRRAARAIAATFALAIAGVALLSLVMEGSRLAALSLLNLVLVIGVPLLWGTEVRRHRDLAIAERARAEEAARAAARDRDAAIAAERARMARDLHDVVAGRLSAIALQSEAALQPGADPEMVRRVLGTVRASGVAALGEMRTMIGLLRDGDAVDPPTAPARLSELDELVDDARRAGLTVRLDDERAPAAEAPAAVELTGYRIVQESLTNAIKHAPGAAVRVGLATDGPGGPLRITVRNDAATRPLGQAPGARAGTGLAGLAERAAAVGGSITAGPDGDGWTVRAELPFDGSLHETAGGDDHSR
ncbi:sensor histidine kinase [Pseudonocardia parietis]|uniref:histidine kinase n=1 Tax=Pseudonocardia parietis TaxID=570936 RepID=A0ABS4VNI5_9PSEU|nr:histidine kinase [Pseudonocardia parietis]MBP2365482.1 signal transduction histidine kinase [Pseudonocardia parietis]